MNRPITTWLLGSVLMGALALLAQCRSAEPEPEAFRIVQREDTLTIAALRKLAALELPSHVRITDSGKEGTFALDAGDLRTADNTGIVLVTAKGHRYKRQFSGAANVAWFGITPDSPDIGPALRQAIAATDELRFPDGTYTQRTEANLRSNLTLRATPGRVLIVLPESYISLVNGKDPTIPLHDVYIGGLSWRVTARGAGRYGVIYIDGPTVTNLTVENCASTDAAAKDSTNWMTLKVQAGRTAANIVVRNNVVQAKRMGCEIFNHDNYGIYAGKTIRVTGNRFENCWFGLSLSGPLTDLVIDDNYVKNCAHFGIEIAGAARNVQITNNRFEGQFDKFLEGSNDGNGNGSVVGGMTITDNQTVGTVAGGIQLYNGGTVQFHRNTFRMSGMLELTHSTAGGTFSENILESAADKAIVCDNSPNNTFTRNRISNQASQTNHATVMAYGKKATNNVLTGNEIIQGRGGKPYAAIEGGSLRASGNVDADGRPLP